VSAAATSEAPTIGADRGSLLLRAIRLDALMSGASGVVLAVGASALDGILGASTAFLVALGIFLLGYSGALLLLAREGAPALGAKAVILGNALWAIASVVAVIAHWLTPTTAGTIVTLAQAAAVTLVADAQLIGLRRRGHSTSL